MRNRQWGASAILLVIAIVIFVFTGFGATIGHLSELEQVSFGLAFLAASFLL